MLQKRIHKLLIISVMMVLSILVMAFLFIDHGDDSLNHAQLMRDLWHPSDKKKEDELRSLFSKMATGKPDADGVVRHFTPDEINKLYELIRGIGK